MKDPTAQFKAAIRAAGLEPPKVIVPGKVLRFPGIGKSKDNKAGWCFLFVDGLGGCYGDWSSGLKKSWQAELDRQLTELERETYKRHVEEARKREKEERQRQYLEAAKVAASIWKNAPPANSDFLYLVHKGIKACGARLHKGKLIVPVSWSGKICSLQLIAPDGRKQFLSGGRTAGGYYCLGSTKNAKTLCIAEGFATGASIHQATDYPVVIAFTTGNLVQLAKAVRQALPESRIIICADDDTSKPGNPGITCANKAAQAIGAKVAIPVFGNPRPEDANDFNDLATLVGLEAVAKVINAAKAPSHDEDANDDNWPDLVPLDTPDLPSLDLVHLPDWAGRLCSRCGCRYRDATGTGSQYGPDRLCHTNCALSESGSETGPR